jgi:serine/threonine-protein kinase RsbW
MIIMMKTSLSEFERTMELIDAFGKENNLSAKVIHDVNLAIDEIVSNIISYGFDDGLEHDIMLSLDIAGDELIIQIEDEGREFNPLEAKAPELDKPLEDREIGGLGIHLVRHVMHHLEYRRNDPKNLLILKKRLKSSK